MSWRKITPPARTRARLLPLHKHLPQQQHPRPPIEVTGIQATTVATTAHTADEALAMGLVNRVVPDGEAVKAAEEIAARRKAATQDFLQQL